MALTNEIPLSGGLTERLSLIEDHFTLEAETQFMGRLGSLREHEAYFLRESFKKLKEMGLHSRENGMLLIENVKNAYSIERILKMAPPDVSPACLGPFLQNLAQANRVHPLLLYLDNNGLLTGERYKKILQKPECAFILHHALVELGRSGLLTAENADPLIEHPEHVLTLAISFQKLQRIGLLDQCRNDLVQHPKDAEALAACFEFIQGEGWDPFEYRAEILTHAPQAVEVVLCFRKLQEQGLLNRANYMALMGNVRYANAIEAGLSLLRLSGLLNQANFEQFLLGNGAHAKALIEAAREGRTPENQEQFDQLIRSITAPAEQAATLLRLFPHMNEDIGERIAFEVLPPGYLEGQPPAFVQSVCQRISGALLPTNL